MEEPLCRVVGSVQVVQRQHLLEDRHGKDHVQTLCYSSALKALESPRCHMCIGLLEWCSQESPASFTDLRFRQFPESVFRAMCSVELSVGFLVSSRKRLCICRCWAADGMLFVYCTALQTSFEDTRRAVRCANTALYDVCGVQANKSNTPSPIFFPRRT